MKINKIFLIVLLSVTAAIMLFNFLTYIFFLKRQNNLLTANFSNLIRRITVLESEMHARRFPPLITKKVASTIQIRETRQTQEIKGRTSDVTRGGNKGYLLKDGRPTN